MVGVDIRTHATHSCTRVACDLSAHSYSDYGQVVRRNDRQIPGHQPPVPCTMYILRVRLSPALQPCPALHTPSRALVQAKRQQAALRRAPPMLTLLSRSPPHICLGHSWIWQANIHKISRLDTPTSCTCVRMKIVCILPSTLQPSSQRQHNHNQARTRCTPQAPPWTATLSARTSPLTDDLSSCLGPGQWNSHTNVVHGLQQPRLRGVHAGGYDAAGGRHELTHATVYSVRHHGHIDQLEDHTTALQGRGKRRNSVDTQVK